MPQRSLRLEENKESSVWKKLAWLILLGLVVYVGLYAASFAYWQWRQPKLTEINGLLTDLDRPLVETAVFTDPNPLLLPNKLNQAVVVEQAINQEVSLIQDKQLVVAAFNNEVNSYRESLVLAKLPTSFIPSDLNSLDFAVKKDSAKYLGELKTKLRMELSKQNQPKVVRRWQVNPQRVVAEMTAAQKVGQMLGFGISGTSLAAADREFIRKYHIGSVVLFGENVFSEGQLQRLTADLQSLNPDIVLLISADQEGGSVRRLRWDNTPGQKQIASLPSTAACTAFTNRSQTLLRSGVNWNLGIVADVTGNRNSFIYPRTFSNDFTTAAKLVEQAVTCTKHTLSTLKHYPGHGATSLDTHRVIATVNRSLNDWKKFDLVPFLSGLKADTIMIGHLVLKELDSKPASLSSKHINYLRTELKYQGLIVSDDIMMLTNAGMSLADATNQAALAGNDMLLYSINNSRRVEVVSNLQKLINEGKIKPEDLNARVIRILEAKNKAVTFTSNYVPSDLVY